MARRRILQTHLARLDLVEIWTQIALDSPKQADGFVDRIGKKLELLARLPRMGRRRDELAPGLRSFPVGDYLIFYKPLEDGIVVVRVLSGFRDIDALFESESL